MANLRDVIPQISLDTSYQPLGRHKSELRNKYIEYTNGNGVSTENAVKIAAQKRLRELAQMHKTRQVSPTEQSLSTSSTQEQSKKNTNVSTDVRAEKGQGSLTPGSRIADTSSYNNNAAKGQCVWYVRGRAVEKLGKDTGAIGNANEMYYNAKQSAKVGASVDNIKPNMIVSYNKGTGSAGQTYGHVIFIEDVVGDTVYYTEGGSGYYKNGTDGVVKTATRQGIIDGVNSAGARMGSEVLGFIDLSKY